MRTTILPILFAISLSIGSVVLGPSTSLSVTGSNIAFITASGQQTSTTAITTSNSAFVSGSASSTNGSSSVSGYVFTSSGR